MKAELTLDAGSWVGEIGTRGTAVVVQPPETTLFHQVLAHLETKPDPPERPSGSMVGREGVVVAAVALRRGSHLAVLLDRDQPLVPGVDSPQVSRISDTEMARINIEASAALANWIDLYRTNRGGRFHFAAGAVELVLFILTGQYRDPVQDHLDGMADGPRMMYRTAHIFILWASLVNVALGAYVARVEEPIRRAMQSIGSAAVALCPLLFTVSFLVESDAADLARPVATLGMYPGLGGTLLQAGAAWMRRIRNP